MGNENTYHSNTPCVPRQFLGSSGPLQECLPRTLGRNEPLLHFAPPDIQGSISRLLYRIRCQFDQITIDAGGRTSCEFLNSTFQSSQPRLHTQACHIPACGTFHLEVPMRLVFVVAGHHTLQPLHKICCRMNASAIRPSI